MEKKTKNLFYFFLNSLRWLYGIFDIKSGQCVGMEEGYCIEDWMELSFEEGEDVILPPRFTNIPCAPVALTINLDEGESSIPEAARISHPIEA